MTTLKIKFILGQISQPRCLKRLEAIKNAGFEIAVYGFDNGLYNENIRNKDYKIHSIRIDGKGNKFVKSIKKILFIKKFVLYRLHMIFYTPLVLTLHFGFIYLQVEEENIFMKRQI